MRRFISRGAAAAIAIAVSTATASASNSAGSNRCEAYAREAAARSGLEVRIILKVMRAESAGNPRAVSRRGAMGCMQIMPATWKELTKRYRLGTNPLDARANMIGGALYLAELELRFGLEGAYAAYNAGPGRYQDFLEAGRSLPSETIHYVTKLAGASPEPRKAAAPWQEAPIFPKREMAEVMATSSRGPGAQSSEASQHETSATSGNELFPLGLLSRTER